MLFLSFPFFFSSVFFSFPSKVFFNSQTKRFLVVFLFSALTKIEIFVFLYSMFWKLDGWNSKKININTFPPDVGVLLCFWIKNNNVCFLFGDNKHEKGLGCIHIMFSVLFFFLFVGRNKFSVGF